jgi:polyphosphate kinase 2 (PPK2 family)
LEIQRRLPWDVIKNDSDKKAEVGNTYAHTLKRRKYENELRKLQIGLCHLQDWVASRGLRVIIIFEGRHAAGKGGPSGR